MKKFFVILMLIALSLGLKSDARNESDGKKMHRWLITEVEKYEKVFRRMRHMFSSSLKDLVTPQFSGGLKDFIEASQLLEMNNVPKNLVEDLKKYTDSMKKATFYREVKAYIRMLNDEKNILTSIDIAELSNDEFALLRKQLTGSFDFGKKLMQSYQLRFIEMGRLFKKLKTQLVAFQEQYRGGAMTVASPLLREKFDRASVTLDKLVKCFKLSSIIFQTNVFQPL